MIEIDPRLRDESLDWCPEYNHLISISRLKAVVKGFESLVDKPFSLFSATLNSFSRASFPQFQNSGPLKVTLSHKSILSSLESPATLAVRARFLFGTGARADLVTFFLTHSQSEFTASDLIEVGYSKRNIAEILDGFYCSGFFSKFMLRNRQRYRLVKKNELIKIWGPVPEYTPSWRGLFEVFLQIRNVLKRTENSSEATKVVTVRNLLITLQKKLGLLNLKPPSLQQDFHAYWDFFTLWLLETVRMKTITTRFLQLRFTTLPRTPWEWKRSQST